MSMIREPGDPLRWIQSLSRPKDGTTPQTADSGQWKANCIAECVQARGDVLMTLRRLFQRELLIRLADDQSAAFICTSKWPVSSRTKRVAISDSSKHPADGNTEQS